MALTSDTVFLVKLRAGEARHGSAIRGVESVEHAPEFQALKQRVELLESILFGIQEEIKKLENKEGESL